MLLKNRYLSIFVLVPILFLSGCTGLNKQKESQEKITEKRERYNALQEAIVEKTIKQGMSSSEIKELFGEPDDAFHSGSSVSTFEIWTYEKISDADEVDLWHPIRLYIDNGRLINWKL